MLFSWTLRARISGSCWARSSVVSRAPAVGGVCVGWGVGVYVGVGEGGMGGRGACIAPPFAAPSARVFSRCYFSINSPDPLGYGLPPVRQDY